MKRLLILAAIAIASQAQAQHYRKPYAVPTDQPQVQAHENVMIMGEAEARAAVLNPRPKATATDQFHYFINQVAKSYEESLQLNTAESGLLIRTLNGLDGNNPSKYAVHFKVEQWFRNNVDAKRFAEWNQLSVYPEYLYSHLLNDPAQQQN